MKYAGLERADFARTGAGAFGEGKYGATFIGFSFDLALDVLTAVWIPGFDADSSALFHDPPVEGVVKVFGQFHTLLEVGSGRVAYGVVQVVDVVLHEDVGGFGVQLGASEYAFWGKRECDLAAGVEMGKPVEFVGRDEGLQQ